MKVGGSKRIVSVPLWKDVHGCANGGKGGERPVELVGKLGRDANYSGGGGQPGNSWREVLPI